MYSSLRMVTPPVIEPVTVEFVSRHARIDFTDDADLVAIYLTSARMAAEQYLGRALITQTLDWTIQEQPVNGAMPLLPMPLLVLPIILSSPQIMNKPIELPRSPTQSIVSVTVTDRDGTITVLQPTDYTADLSTDPGRIKMHWLTTPTRLLHVSIRFIAGYGDTIESVPLQIRHAIMVATAYYYENRGDTGGDLPDLFYKLLTPLRLVYFGSPG